jgi:hypothetical protein
MKTRLLAAACALAVPGAALAATAPKAGTYEGTVAAGYGAPQITLTVKQGKVVDLVARMFYSCNNGPQEQTVVAPPKAFKVNRSGAFSGRTVQSIGGIASETVWVNGRFTSATRAKGTIRSQTVGGGETCDTQERTFTVKRK